MRPVRIELEGFSAYRRSVTADFDGVDFFSLSGPTGSGKSSLIDAMVFALFGRVPRLGGNAVAPAITAGADRARVRLDFIAEGQLYTAVRLAQRTATGGATVKEARLQLGDQVLADGADDVTAAVEELLRMRFDDFTRTVVLPQGDFARFLTATRSERQGLLRSLLGMEVYTRVRELAKRREVVATERAEGARRTLDGLDLAGKEEIAAARARRDRLADLAEEMPAWEKAIAEHDLAASDAEARSRQLAEGIHRLKTIEPPERLTELDALFAEARSALSEAEEERAAAAEALRAAEEEVRDLPSPDQITGWVRVRSRLAEIGQRLADPEAEDAQRLAGERKVALEEGLSRLEEARTHLEETRSSHAAHVLTAGLTIGDACPVCSQQVTEIPDRPAPPELDELIEKKAKATADVESLRRLADEAGTELTRIEANRAGLEEQRTALVAELEDAPGDKELVTLEEKVKALGIGIDTMQETLAKKVDEEKAAHARLDDLADRSRQVAKLFRVAERSVSDLQPPLSESDDVVVQWKELISWRDQTLESLNHQLQDVEQLVAEKRKEAEAKRQALLANLDDHAVPAREPYAVQVATELQTVRAFVDAQVKAAEDAAQLKGVAEESATEAAVAASLANHLRANGFEQWLMAGALNDLVSGANDLLGQLSADGYSLDSDDTGDFSIIDHRNADEKRSVSTLSGGETFLVSLALALSLAETLAAKGGSGLDAIILDEGFGTLDDESLDIVASVLEELAGRGLMVGVITHVKELAMRAPVRYEVGREPEGAAVRVLS